MKKLSKLFTVIFSTLLLFSCNNGIILNENMAQIVLHLEDTSARTAFAPIRAQTFKDIKLDYKKTDSSDEYKNLVTYKTFEEIASDTTYAAPGTYDFKISANAGGFIYMAEVYGETITSGVNTITAELSLTNFETSRGTGTFELTYKVVNQAVSNYAEYTVFKNGSVLSGYENIPCTLSDDENDKVKVVAKSVDGKALASGMYRIVITVYTDEFKCLAISSMEDSIQIVDGVNTTGTYSRNYLDYDVSNIVMGSVSNDTNNAYVILNNKVYINGKNAALTLTADELTAVSQHPYFGNDIEEAYIGDGITSIGSSLFYGSSKLRILTGCENVTEIGSSTFANTNLRKITLPSKVTKIGDSAFAGYDKDIIILLSKNVAFEGNNQFARPEWSELQCDFYFAGTKEAFNAAQNGHSLGLGHVQKGTRIFYGATGPEHKCQHNWEDFSVAKEPSILVPGNKNQKCSLCLDDRVETGSIPCLFTSISDKDGNKLSTESVNVGDYVYFGKYPQTIKADNVSITSETFTKEGYEYQKGDDGNWYFKQVEIRYYRGAESSTYSNGQKADTPDRELYFKVEPLKWRVVKKDGNKVTLVSDKIIASGGKDPNYRDDPYNLDNVHDFLVNGQFMKMALDGTAQNKLVSDSSVASGDKVYLMNYAEASSYLNDNIKRAMYATDYAKATGLKQIVTEDNDLLNNLVDSNGYCKTFPWILRPSEDNGSSYNQIKYDGILAGYSIDYTPIYGIVPALTYQ